MEWSKDETPRYFRYAIRLLLKSPGFTAVAVISLALGIGANTALFSVVDAMLLKMLPVKDPERLVLFRSMALREFSPGYYSGNAGRDPMTGQRWMTSFPYQSFQRMREQESALGYCRFGGVSLNVNADGRADVAVGQAVSGNYFAVLGVQPWRGRVLTEDDDKPAANPVAVLSHRYWQQRFGANPAVISQQINLNTVPFTVAGITPPGFEGTMDAGSTQDVTIPISWEPQLYVERERSRMHGAGVWWFRLMGRLKPGATAEQARVQLESAFHQSVVEHARRARLSAGIGAKPGSLRWIRKTTHACSSIPRTGRNEFAQYYAPSLYLLLRCRPGCHCSRKRRQLSCCRAPHHGRRNSVCVWR